MKPNIPTTNAPNDDAPPPIRYLALVHQVYCCNCRTMHETVEPFTIHPITNGVHKRKIIHTTEFKYYNLPVVKERSQPVAVPFCQDCLTADMFKDKPKAPPAVIRTSAPSWVGRNSPNDYTIAGTLKHKEPKAKGAKAPKSYTLDDLD